MIKYYAYYSVGGYKDMYLGNSEMNDEATYFLPLLPVMKKKAEKDPSLANKIESLEKLPKIEILSAENLAGLPQEALTMISHGGYKVMLRTTSSGENILAFKDIISSEKDESGRSIPFMFLMSGSKSDKIDVIASYFMTHIDATGNQLSSMFAYDAEKNGLKFNLEDINNMVNDIKAKSSATFVLTTEKSLRLSLNPDSACIVVSKGIPVQTAIEEQKLQGIKTQAVLQENIIPLDDTENLPELLEKLLAKKSLYRQASSLGLLGGGLLIGFIIGYLITR